MPRPPVALHEPPRPRHVNRIPRVPEAVVLELDAGLVPCRLAVAFDHNAVQTRVAVEGKGVLGGCFKGLRGFQGDFRGVKGGVVGLLRVERVFKWIKGDEPYSESVFEVISDVLLPFVFFCLLRHYYY